MHKKWCFEFFLCQPYSKWQPIKMYRLSNFASLKLWTELT